MCYMMMAVFAENACMVMIPAPRLNLSGSELQTQKEDDEMGTQGTTDTQ